MKWLDYGVIQLEHVIQHEGIGKEAHAVEFSALLNCNRVRDARACGDCSNSLRIKSFQSAII